MGVKTFCLGCVQKHLEQAMILHEEVLLGYPTHIHRVRGHLAEASREAVQKYPQFANILREHRLALVDNVNYMPPYDELLAFVDVLIACEQSGIEVPQIPETIKRKEDSMS